MVYLHHKQNKAMDFLFDPNIAYYCFTYSRRWAVSFCICIIVWVVNPFYLQLLSILKHFYDSLWHDGLFYKLLNIYYHVLIACSFIIVSSVKCVTLVRRCVSNQFIVLRGTRQVSSLSPALFNIFINDLLVTVQSI